MLKLYHHHTSVCAAKSRLALDEKGLEWEGEIICLRRHEKQRHAHGNRDRNGLKDAAAQYAAADGGGVEAECGGGDDGEERTEHGARD
ncbi:MAG: glutathione S-transferase N-terminal domain-containing protein [Alphaproteobacteria bacterium]|nr:glutathione S-transferase N-terminal domain-containing protein [Alphaproteobacteria bacterium]